MIVPYDDTYRAIVTDSWRRSARRLYAALPNEQYRDEINRQIDIELGLPGMTGLSRCLLSVDDDARWMVHGWALGGMRDGGMYVPYAYTRSAFRGRGIAAALVRGLRAVTGIDGPVYYSVRAPPYTSGSWGGMRGGLVGVR